jgi:hypothetical protein
MFGNARAVTLYGAMLFSRANSASHCSSSALLRGVKFTTELQFGILM